MTTDVRVARVNLDKITFHPHNVRHDLGDLRGLADSIRRFGVIQPIVLEAYGDTYRLRAGHRRVAAARIAGLKTIPALIHAAALDDDEWLIHSVQENVMRQGLDRAERARAVDALRELGCTWEGIGESFGVSSSTAKAWSSDNDPHSGPNAERMGLDRARVVELVRQGRSNTQIADQLGWNVKRVTRLRAQACPPADRAPQRQSRGAYVVSKRSIRGLCDALDAAPGLTAAQAIAAFRRLAETGRVEDAMPDELATRREAM